MTIRFPSITGVLARRCVFPSCLALIVAAPAFAQTATRATGQPPTRAAGQPPAQPAPAAPAVPGATAPAPADAAATQAPADYIIGVDDVLQILFWREKELTNEVTVRPDGMISLALLNDIRAAGLTTLQLRTAIMEAARKFVTDPSVTVTVKTINSRKVFVAGQVNKPGPYPMIEPMTVLQALAVAGGLVEFAGVEDILIMRTEQGQTKSFRFNYKEVRRGRKLEQNILLKPGDTVVVP